MAIAAAAAALRDFGRRHRGPITIVGSLATAGLLAVLLSGRRHEFAAAMHGPAWWIVVLAVTLQVTALVARSEAWHLTVDAAGAMVGRRVLILGGDGVAAAAAAGVLLTATGTAGGLCFAAWAGADRLWSGRRVLAQA